MTERRPGPMEATSAAVDDLGAVLTSVAAVLDRVRVIDRGRPTSCPGWTLGYLAGHVVGSTEAFATVLEGGPTPARARLPEAEATGARMRAAARRCVTGWRRPSTWARQYVEVLELDDGVLIPPIPIDPSLLADIQLLDAGVHLFDLTQALEMAAPITSSTSTLAGATLAAARRVLQPGIRELAGFGPEQPARPGADAVEALLAYAGRRPRPMG